MKTPLLFAPLLAAACTAPVVEPPGDDHPASVSAASGVLPEFALQDDSPLRGETTRERSDTAGGHQHRHH